MKNEFNEFLTACEDLGLGLDIDEMSNSDKYKVGNVWSNVKEFLSTYNLIQPNKVASFEDISEPTCVLNSAVNIVEIGPKVIEDLVESCNISKNYIPDATKAVALCISKYSSQNVIAEHFSSKEMSVENLSATNFKQLNSIYSDVALEGMFDTKNAAIESFGVSIDNNLLDAKLAIAITILKFHKSIMPRLMPNKPVTSNVVMYEVDHFEMYDLSKAGAETAQERYKNNSRVPFLDLYINPSPANTAPKPVIVKNANDTSGDFVDDVNDGYLYVSKNANLFDLSMDTGVIGYDHVDYTDLIGEGAKLDTLVLKANYDDGDGTVYEEYIPLKVIDRAGARFVMSPNTNEAADRLCSLDFVTNFDNETPMMNGVDSEIMSLFNDNVIIVFEINAQGKLNLRTSYVNVMASLKTSIQTTDGTSLNSVDEDNYNFTTFAIESYKIDATFSEENIRKTTKAMRILTRPIGYEIPGTANTVVQHSIVQSRPEKTINALSNLMRIGNDDRGINIIIDAIQNVYNRIQQEKNDITMVYDQKVMNDFVAGHKVMPFIYQDTIAIDSTVNVMRSAEALSDVRGFFEKKLLEIITLMHNNSLFVQALAPGIRPTFKVLTSGYILDSVLNVPYYHTALDQSPAEKQGDDVVEYKRILPNGTELQIITTNFDSIADKLIIVPHIPGKPDSELNFGHVLDRGTLVVNFTPVINNAGFKEIVANAREFPIILNPLCAYITVTGISNIYTGIKGFGGI